MPYIAGLPMPHAFAPSASALTTSLPRRMPPSSQTSSFDRRPASVSMEMISGSASIDDRAVSMLRPSRASASRERRSFAMNASGPKV